MGKQFESVPGSADQSGPTMRCALEEELAAGTAECSVQMGWMQLVVGTQLNHGRGLLRHIKCQPMRCIPGRDWLYEDSGRKDATAYSAHASTRDLGSDGTGDTPSVVPCLGWWQVREIDDTVPDRVDVSCDMDLGLHDPFRLGAGEMFDPSDSGQQEQDC